MLSIVKNIYVMTYQDYAMNDSYGLSVGRLTAWDRPMSVPVTCSHRGGRDIEYPSLGSSNRKIRLVAGLQKEIEYLWASS